MTADYVFALLLGHMVGDYLLQNQWMALNKSRTTRVLPGIVHAQVYTWAVLLCTQDFRYPWFVVIFLSHWPIDRYSLAERWLKLIGGRTMAGFVQDGHMDIPPMSSTTSFALAERMEMNYRILRGGFTSLVYAVADNTLHLLLMWAGWHLLHHFNL